MIINPNDYVKVSIDAQNAANGIFQNLVRLNALLNGGQHSTATRMAILVQVEADIAKLQDEVEKLKAVEIAAQRL